mgnify:FL=1
MANEVKTVPVAEEIKEVAKEVVGKTQEVSEDVKNPVQQVPTIVINNTYGNPTNPSFQTPIEHRQLRTNRSMLKSLIFGFLTFGIYYIVIEDHISDELNLIVTRYDARRTMRFGWIFFIFSWLTLGIAPIVWYHRTSDRMNFELRRRNIDYSFGTSDFWLWYILGSMIVVGPFIYLHKRMTTMNLINADYNQKG